MMVRMSADLPAALLATVAVRASVVLAGAWLITRLLNRSAAATRHAVWSVALASLLIVPLLWIALPRWELGRAPAAAEPATMPMIEQAPSTMVSPSQAPLAMPEHDHSQMGAPSEVRAGTGVVALIALAAWALGAAFGLGRLSAGWAAALRLVRRARPFGDLRVAQTANTLCIQLGITRAVRVLASSTLPMPVNCGLFRPVVLLPEAARTWSAERLRVVLLHELAHVKRWDYAALIASEAARALYWVNPLVWLAARRANVELERACDDEVLRAGTRSVEYAEHLYEIAASLADAKELRGALAMAQPSTLGTRVRAILTASMDRSPLKLRAILGAALLALVVGIPLASLRLLGEGRAAAEIRAAVRTLSMGTPEQRAQAVWSLGHNRASYAVAPLIARLHDPDPTVRGMAAWALGQVKDRQALVPLMAALRDTDSDVREMAVLGLGELGDRHAVDSLARMAHDPEMGVRGVLTHSLHTLGGDAAGRALSRMVLTDGDEHVRDMATWALRLSQGHKSLPTLIEALRTGEAGTRQSAAANLGELGDPEAIEPLGSAATRDQSKSVRGTAAYALGKLHDPRAAEPLATVMADSAWNVRVAAAAALGDTPGPRATQTLIAATRDPVHQVRLTAVEALNNRAN